LICRLNAGCFKKLFCTAALVLALNDVELQTGAGANTEQAGELTLTATEPTKATLLDLN